MVKQLMQYIIPAAMLVILASGCSDTPQLSYGEDFPTPYPLVPGMRIIKDTSADTTAVETNIYWDNTFSQKGYVKNDEFARFYYAVTQSLKNPHYWTLEPDKSNTLHWEKTEKNDPTKEAFYVEEKGEARLPKDSTVGPLKMFIDDETKYGNDTAYSLTVIISDLEEQRLELTSFGKKLADICKTNNYSIMVLAIKLQFKGYNFRPTGSSLSGTTRLWHEGQKPLYALVFGHPKAVKDFENEFSTNAENFGITGEGITGKVDTLSIQQPLNVADIKKSIPPNANEDMFDDLFHNGETVRYGVEEESKYIPPFHIWNVRNETDKENYFDERINALFFAYYNDTRRHGKEAMWRINIPLPKTIAGSQTAVQIENYHQLVKNSESSTGQNTQELEQKEAPLQWEQNKIVDMDVGIRLPRDGKDDVPAIYIVPKNEFGTLQSPVVYFEIVVTVNRNEQNKLDGKESEELWEKQWVKDFTTIDILHPKENQDKTFFFQQGIRALSQIQNEIRIPVVLFNMPWQADKTS